MPIRLLLSVLLLAFVANATAAETARLKLPDFRHLQGKAIESVDITIGPMLLGLARKFGANEDPDAQRILNGVKSISIRNYQFEAEDAYSRADLEGVRQQLADELWKPLAQIRSRDQDNVDIFVAIDNNQPVGFAILAVEPREFTIVNIVGTIDFEDLGKVQGSLGLPKGSMHAVAHHD